MTLIDELEQLREKQELSYRTLAEKCGLKLPAMHNSFYRKANKYIYAHLDVLAAALGADADDLRARYLQTLKPPKMNPEAEEEAQESRLHRYDLILQAVREGVPDAEIMKSWPALTGDVLMVYHKIAEGRLCNLCKTKGKYDQDMRRILHDEIYDGIAFRTGSLSGLRVNYNDFDALGRW